MLKSAWKVLKTARFFHEKEEFSAARRQRKEKLSHRGELPPSSDAGNRTGMRRPAAAHSRTHARNPFKPMPIENAEKLLAQPNNADYWDMRRDLMRRDHPFPRVFHGVFPQKTCFSTFLFGVFREGC